MASFSFVCTFLKSIMLINTRRTIFIDKHHTNHCWGCTLMMDDDDKAHTKNTIGGGVVEHEAPMRM